MQLISLGDFVFRVQINEKTYIEILIVKVHLEACKVYIIKDRSEEVITVVSGEPFYMVRGQIFSITLDDGSVVELFEFWGWSYAIQSVTDICDVRVFDVLLNQ